MKKTIALLALCMTSAAHGATPTTDTPVATLLPNSQYQVTANVSTNDVATLLGLLAGGQSPLEVVDGDGNVLAAVPAQTLIDDLTGLTGAVTRQISLTLNTGTTDLTNLVTRVLDSPPSVGVGNVTVEDVTMANPETRPVVKVTHKSRDGLALRIRGTATDNGVVKRVDVRTNGHLQKAQGTNRWGITTRLHAGANHLAVFAYDSTQHVSAPKKFTVFVNP